MIRSIFSRLLLSHLVVILITVITLGALMTYLIRGHVVENKRQEILAKGAAVVTLITPVVNSGRVPYRLDLLGDLVGTEIWLVNQQGKVLAGDPPRRWTRTLPENSAQLEALFNGNPQSWVRSSRNQADPSIVVALPVPGGAAPTALFLYTPITGVNQAIQALDKLTILSLLLGTLAAIILGFFIARSLTKPIADISQAAVRFAGGDYTSRTGAVGQDEIGKLGRVFNEMAESLAHIEQNRRDFLANVSHELKTPVASIQALAEALQDGVVSRPEQQQRYLATIVDQSKHIDRLIHDLLDLAQLEAGELTIVTQHVDMAAFLTTEAAKYQHFLSAKNLKLALDLPANLPLAAADVNRLSQVLANLVSNAIRHSPENGVITIAASSHRSHIAVTVADHGTGIDPVDQARIWDRFYRAEKSRSRESGGTGLGLSIAKLLVQAMGGDISVTSTPGKGAAFTFTVPVASQQK
jgi:signal transduction histidine kinase